MRAINIHEAKTHLSRLVEQAARGESFIIEKSGRPMVKVVAIDPAESPSPPKRLGFLPHAKVPDDFDTMHQEEIIRLFEGEG